MSDDLVAVNFLDQFVWKPNPNITTRYHPGVMRVPQAAADAAIAAGKAKLVAAEAKLVAADEAEKPKKRRTAEAAEE